MEGGIVMRSTEDLDRLDKATLRAWRWSNLVGWSLAGMGVTFLVAQVHNIVQPRLAFLPSPWDPWVSIALILGSGAAGGAIVGAHVYRSPGLVTFLGQAVVSLAWIGWDFTVGNQSEAPLIRMLFYWIFSLLWALPAALTAMVVWNRRPRALRAIGSPG
jgi:hypothetical protein